MKLIGMQSQKVCLAFSPGLRVWGSQQRQVCHCEAWSLGVGEVGERGWEALSPYAVTLTGSGVGLGKKMILVFP